MLKTKIKRVALDSHQSQYVDEEARSRSKHQVLLQDYLDLQKEFVSNKRKFQTAQHKQEILLAEVRFLQQRLRYLMKIQSDNLQPEQELVPPEKLAMQSEVVGEPSRVEKMSKNCLTGGKKVGKKKISWQDQVALKF